MDKSCKQGRLKAENLKAQLKLFQNDPSVGRKLSWTYWETSWFLFCPGLSKDKCWGSFPVGLDKRTAISGRYIGKTILFIFLDNILDWHENTAVQMASTCRDCISPFHAI